MKVVRENVHPSQFPENQDRMQLHGVFGHFKNEFLQLLGSDRPFDGCKKVWVIYLGANIKGQMHFVCHVTEDHKTASAYNSEDSTTPQCPVLLYGEPLYVPESFLTAMDAQMPDCHRGKVPLQAAFAITRRAVGTYHHHYLHEVLNGTCSEMETAIFKIKRMSPSGMQSLSFKTPDCPLEFWTHLCRAPVIFTALDLEKKKDAPDPKLINLYEQACQLENAFKAASDAIKALSESIKKTNEQIAKECKAHKDLLNNKNIPLDRLQKISDEKWSKIQELDTRSEELLKTLNDAEDEVRKANAAIDQFKEDHFERLPHSYREATFQIAFDTTFPDGSVVYKQYNGASGLFELSRNPAREVRYGNDVHIGYKG